MIHKICGLGGHELFFFFAASKWQKRFEKQILVWLQAAVLKMLSMRVDSPFIVLLVSLTGDTNLKNVSNAAC